MTTDSHIPEVADDIIPSQAIYRELVDIRGYRLFKPIEVVVFEVKPRGMVELYTARHRLPTPDGIGELIKASGSTLDDAVNALGQKLADKLTNLLQPQAELTQISVMQSFYLNSIMKSVR